MRYRPVLAQIAVVGLLLLPLATVLAQAAPTPAPPTSAATPATTPTPAPAAAPAAAPAPPAAAAAAPAPEEQLYDERGFVKDYTSLSLSFTSGSTENYDYEDVRIYSTVNAHYAFPGDDYLDAYLFINKLDRTYDDPRYTSGDITSIFNGSLVYVFDGVDKYEYGMHHSAGATFFSDDMFENVEIGLGYGATYLYPEGSLRLLAGFGRNLGYEDDWSPRADLSLTHNRRLSPQWSVRAKADVFWREGRKLQLNGETLGPDAVFLLDGTLTYQLVKGWSVYIRYFNENSSDDMRSYWSLGLSHTFRAPARRPAPK